MRLLCWLICGCLLVTGCGQGEYRADRFHDGSGSPATNVSGSSGGQNQLRRVEFHSNSVEDDVLSGPAFGSPTRVAQAGGEVPEPAGADKPSADNPLRRRIIYVAHVSLVVTDFAKTESDMPRLVSRYGGHLADVSVDRTEGKHRSGRWTARVPVARFDAFLEALEDLGIPEERSQTAQDVSEEFVDLESRIANKKRLEERILKLLEDRADEIKDVIEVERELGRVREEIERMQGRLRYLADRTELTTVTITAREEREYVPPQAPTFTGRLAAVWFGSFETLQRAGELLAIAAVALTPWLILIVPAAVLVRWQWKRMRVSR